MYVGTSELHFCSPHWIQKYLGPKKKLSLCKTPLFYITPMHTLPLFCPTPCMPSPYSIPPMHALPYSIPPMHTLPLFYPASCIPWPLFYPSSCIPCPLFYPSSCTPSPYSIPPHTCPPLFLSHCMHVCSCSLPAHTCHPSILFQLMHALLTPCHMNLEGMFLLWHLRMPLLNLLTLSLSSSFT